MSHKPSSVTPTASDYVALLQAAKAHVSTSPLYRRFIEHTPLENDIAVWMADFATEVLHMAEGIGWAIKQMHNGARVTRPGWNGRGMWLALQVPDEQSKMTLPYIYMKTADDQLVPWLASQSDLLAMDWMVVPDGSADENLRR